MVDWRELEDDILIEIEKHLLSIKNYDSFAAVCKSWRSAATKDKHHLNLKTFQGPWLMVAREKSLTQTPTHMREFFSVSSGNTRAISLLLPYAAKKTYLSCKDWLFIIAEDSIHVCLFHPMSHVRINLPKLDTAFGNKDFVIDNVVLSANPNSTSEFILMVLLLGESESDSNNQLGFWKPGDNSWTAIDSWGYVFSRIIYHDEKLYALDRSRGIFLRCDIHGSNPTQLHSAFVLSPMKIHHPYLVEFSKKFYVVSRSLIPQKNHCETRKFEVYEVNIDNKEMVEIKDLGNKALFFDKKSSFFLECSDVHNFKANCIYFLEDNMNNANFPEGGKDMRIYHLSDGSIEPLFHENIVWSKDEQLIWIGPSF